MQKCVFFLHDICSVIGTSLTLIMLYLYLCCFMMGDSSFQPLSICFICAAVFSDYLLRRYIHNLILYILLHFIPFLILPALKIPPYGIFLLVCIGLFIFYHSIVYWKKDGLEKHLHAISFPDETIIFYILVFIHSYYGLSKSLTLYVYSSGVAFFIISQLLKYFNKIINNIHSLSATSRNMPDKIYSLNSTLVVMFTIFIFLFAVGISLVLSENSFNFIGRFLQYLGSMIMGIFSLIASKKQPHENTPDVSQSSGDSQNSLPAIETADNPIANAIFVLMQIIIYFFIVVGVIYLIYTFFKTYMYRNRNSEDIIEDSHKNTDTKVRISKKFSFKDIFSSLSGKDKIRKLYYKKVCELEKGRVTIKNSNTPDEISDSIKKTHNISIDELTAVYKKARYGNHDITKEEVTYCKNLVKKEAFNNE